MAIAKPLIYDWWLLTVTKPLSYDWRDDNFWYAKPSSGDGEPQPLELLLEYPLPQRYRFVHSKFRDDINIYIIESMIARLKHVSKHP